MLWDLEWGSEFKDLLAQWRRSKQKPPALQKKPKLGKVERYYYDAFLELSPSRSSGEVCSAIPQNQYQAWFETWGIYGLERRDRHQRILTALDAVFVKYCNDERAKKMEEMKNRSGGKSGGSRKLVKSL